MTASQVPEPVRAALDAWLPPVCAALGERLRAVYLGGGAALGEFAPRWSDVDLWVVLGAPPEEEALLRLRRIQADLYRRHVEEGEAGWVSGQFVEGPLVEPAVLAAADSLGPGWHAVEGEIRGPMETCFEPFERLVLARHGVLLEGSPVPVLPPAEAALKAELQAGLEALVAPRWHRPIWLAGMLHWLARSLAFWRDGVLLPKSAALEREIAQGSPFAAALGLAREVREAGSRTCAGRADALRGAFRATSSGAARLLAEAAGMEPPPADDVEW